MAVRAGLEPARSSFAKKANPIISTPETGGRGCQFRHLTVFYENATLLLLSMIQI